MSDDIALISMPIEEAMEKLKTHETFHLAPPQVPNEGEYSVCGIRRYPLVAMIYVIRVA